MPGLIWIGLGLEVIGVAMLYRFGMPPMMKTAPGKAEHDLGGQLAMGRVGPLRNARIPTTDEEGRGT